MSKGHGHDPLAIYDWCQDCIREHNLPPSTLIQDIADFLCPKPIEVIVRGPKHLWERDDVQFPRLLAEIKAVGLTPEQMQSLSSSMDLSKEDIHELLDRAEETFDAAKEQLDFVDERCVACNAPLDYEIAHPLTTTTGLKP